MCRSHLHENDLQAREAVATSSSAGASRVEFEDGTSNSCLLAKSTSVPPFHPWLPNSDVSSAAGTARLRATMFSADGEEGGLPQRFQDLSHTFLTLGPDGQPSDVDLARLAEVRTALLVMDYLRTMNIPWTMNVPYSCTSSEFCLRPLVVFTCSPHFLPCSSPGCLQLPFLDQHAP